MTVAITTMRTPEDLYVRRFEPSGDARYALVLVHGTAGHGGCYSEWAQRAAAVGCVIYSGDLTGHGRSGGARGIFTMAQFLDDVAVMCRLAADETGLPVILLGSSQGGEIAFRAVEHAGAQGVICLNILLNAELPMNRKIRWFQGRLGAALERLVGDRLRIPLRWVIDFAAAYRDDPALLPAKLRDTDYVWSYGFASYRSVFAYQPERPADQTQAPVLVVCGERDPIVPAQHCADCAQHIGADLAVVPGVGHGLMHACPDQLIAIVDDWIERRVLGDAVTWSPPSSPEDQRWRAFIDRQRAAAGSGEADYNYSLLDEALCRLCNGDLARSIETFANGQEVRRGRFITRLLLRIDRVTWTMVGPSLPATGTLAVIGCGRGDCIDTLLETCPKLQDWRLVGVDADPRGLAAARTAHPDVTFIAGDATESLEPDSLDAIYLHGILDHCAGHRALLSRCAHALRPGGRLIYVTPDRNILTWLAFVALGPRFLFRMVDPFHDYRRFTRPAELERLLRDVGLEPEAQFGVEYANRHRLLSVCQSIRGERAEEVAFEVTGPRWWLGGGFAGEYAGLALRPE